MRPSEVRPRETRLGLSGVMRRRWLSASAEAQVKREVSEFLSARKTDGFASLSKKTESGRMAVFFAYTQRRLETILEARLLHEQSSKHDKKPSSQ